MKSQSSQGKGGGRGEGEGEGGRRGLMLDLQTNMLEPFEHGHRSGCG